MDQSLNGTRNFLEMLGQADELFRQDLGTKKMAKKKSGSLQEAAPETNPSPVPGNLLCKLSGEQPEQGILLTGWLRQ